MSRRSRFSDVQLGIFVLGALAILVVGSLWIVGSARFGAPRATYEVLLSDSAGLASGGPVRFAGVRVGRIQSVELRPGEVWPVRMTVAVRQEIPIRTDSRARVATVGLFGEPFLALGSGSPGAGRLPEGGSIEGDPASGMDAAMEQLDVLAGQAGEVMDKTSVLLEQLSGELGPILGNLERLLSAENAENVEVLLAELRMSAEALGPRLENLLEGIEKSVAGVPELREQLIVIARSMDSALGPDGERLAQVLDGAESNLTAAELFLSSMSDNRHELEGAIRDLRDTLANLKAFSRELEQRPSSLVRSKPRPERRPGDPAEGQKP